MKNFVSAFQFKLIILVGIFAGVLYISSKTGNMVEFAEKILNGGSTESDPTAVTAETFTEPQQESMKKQFKGFWIFSGTESQGVQLDDYIELLENGIMWQYERRIFDLPYGDKDTLIRASTSYLLPFEKLDTLPNGATCYLRLIRQNWQIDGNFCYGPSQKILDNMYTGKAQNSDIVTNWTAVRTDNETLTLNGNPYKKYSGELTAFFPDSKAIASVDDPTTYGCEGDDPHLIWIRNKIIESIKSQPLESNVVPMEQILNLKNFYIPYCLNRLEISYGKNDGEKLNIEASVSPTGSITSVKLKGKPVDSPSIKSLLISEISQWTLHGTGEESKVTVETTVHSRF